jgi:hypothetical protein
MTKMKLWQVRDGYETAIVIAKTETRALAIAKEKYGWGEYQVQPNVQLITADLISEFSERVFGE